MVGEKPKFGGNKKTKLSSFECIQFTYLYNYKGNCCVTNNTRLTCPYVRRGNKSVQETIFLKDKWN